MNKSFSPIKKNTLNHKRRGGILVAVIIFVGVFMAILGSFMKITAHDFNMTAKVNDGNRAYHMASAGLVTAIEHLNDKNAKVTDSAIIKPKEWIKGDDSLNQADRLYFFTEDESTEEVLEGGDGTESFTKRTLKSYGVANDEIVKLETNIQLSAKGPPPDSFAIINYFKYRDYFYDDGYTDADGKLVGAGNQVLDYSDSGFSDPNTKTLTGANNKKYDFLDNGDDGQGGVNPDWLKDGTHQDTEPGELGEKFHEEPATANGVYDEPIFTVLNGWQIFGSIYTNSSVAFNTVSTDTDAYGDRSLIVGPENYRDYPYRDAFYTRDENYVDVNLNGYYEKAYDIFKPEDDIIRNGKWDKGEKYTENTAVVENTPDFNNGVYDYGFITHDTGWVFPYPGYDENMDQTLDKKKLQDRDAASKTSDDRKTLQEEGGAYQRNFTNGFTKETTYKRDYYSKKVLKTQLVPVKVNSSYETFNTPFLEAPDLNSDSNFKFYSKADADGKIVRDGENNLTYDYENALKLRQYDVYFGKDGLRRLKDIANPSAGLIQYDWEITNFPTKDCKQIQVGTEWSGGIITDARDGKLPPSAQGQDDPRLQYVNYLRNTNPYLFLLGGASKSSDSAMNTDCYRTTYDLDDMTAYLLMFHQNARYILGHEKNDNSSPTLTNPGLTPTPDGMEKLYNHKITKDGVNLEASASDYLSVQGVYLKPNAGLTGFDLGTFDESVWGGVLKNHPVGGTEANFKQFAKDQLTKLNTGFNLSMSFGGDPLPTDANWFGTSYAADVYNNGDTDVRYYLPTDIWISPEMNNKIIYIDGNLEISQHQVINYRFETGEPYLDTNYDGIRNDGSEPGFPPEYFMDLNNNGEYDFMDSDKDGVKDPLNVTFAIRGNLVIGDDIWYPNMRARGMTNNVFKSNQDMVTFIVVSHPDDDVFFNHVPSSGKNMAYEPGTLPTGDEKAGNAPDHIVKDNNEPGWYPHYNPSNNSKKQDPPLGSTRFGAAEGSGHIYLGHEQAGTLYTIHGRFYADNYFYANDIVKTGTPDYSELHIFGSFMGGAAVVFNGGDKTKQLIFHHDGRYWPFQDEVSLSSTIPEQAKWDVQPGTFNRVPTTLEDRTKVEKTLTDQKLNS